VVKFYEVDVEAILQVSIGLFEVEAKVTSMNLVDVSRPPPKEPEKPDNFHKIALSNPLETTLLRLVLPIFWEKAILIGHSNQHGKSLG